MTATSADTTAEDVTEGHLLGGAVRYRQPRLGYRTGIEPVLMAAAIPARPGQQVLEAGTGAGAGLLCLSQRVSGLTGWGVERETAMARIATDNLALNGRAELAVSCTDVTEPGAAAARAAWSGRLYDHVFANPPWHPEDGTRTAEPLRAAAKVAAAGLVAGWIGVLASRLRGRGSLTLILPAAAVPEALAACAQGSVGGLRLLPLWPRREAEARLVIVQGRRDDRSAFRLLPGLTLHAADGAAFTPEAEAILRRGGALTVA